MIPISNTKFNLMKKIIIVLTLFAFIIAGALSMNKVQAKAVSKDLKIEMVKLDQDPTKNKDGEKTKKSTKANASPDVRSSHAKKNPAAAKTSSENLKQRYAPADKEATDKKQDDPNIK